MSRILPFPVLSLLIMALWLLFNMSLSPLNLTIGVILGVVLGQAMLLLDPNPPNIKRPLAILRLFFIVSYDVVRSNFAMFGIIIGSRRRHPSSGFVNVPLDIRNRYGLAALSTIITSAPGTFWAAYDSRTGVLTIHVLDLVDEEYWVRTIKHRYEDLLREIFE